jgi:hypothetical protein
VPVDLRVTCVNKPEPLDPHGRILGIGGVDDFGTPWYLSAEQAIAAMDAREFRFFIVVEGWRAKLVGAQGPDGGYLTTADGPGAESLLRLPPCPRASP